MLGESFYDETDWTPKICCINTAHGWVAGMTEVVTRENFENLRERDSAISSKRPTVDNLPSTPAMGGLLLSRLRRASMSRMRLRAYLAL